MRDWSKSVSFTRYDEDSGSLIYEADQNWTILLVALELKNKLC